ncbi:lysine biosynthesis protein LysX [Fodinicola feengrottensis]|uniref:Lysine biosynthesis protein LysX n=1 Tax=Fodinicola feengrottensis TaxID=435914 RepID=A0ABN2GQH0_9ACTN|nr:lysine biosynthesis protein LysX [Fodinicola feengrottensis]
MPGRPLAVLASRVRVEEKLILAELDRRGVPYEHLDTRQFVATLPPVQSYAAVLGREISQTRQLYACRVLEAAGTPTVNTADVIALCGDKLLTSLELSRRGLPTPRTAVVLSNESALAAIEDFGFPVVIKPLVGSWGRLAAVIRDPETARTVLEHRAALSSPQHQVVYLQELIDKPDRDIRVIVVGDEVLGAYYRCSPDWRTNVARGARSEPCPLTDELVKLSLETARAMGGGLLGVDLIEDRDGRLYVLEVNHTMEFRGFLAAHGDRIDVPGAIVDYLLAQAVW